MTQRQIQRLANTIVDDLFSNRSGQQAKRLVLELLNGSDGGGWGKDAAAVRIAMHLTKALGDKPKAKVTRSTR